MYQCEREMQNNKIIYLHEDIFRKVSPATSPNLVLYLKFKLCVYALSNLCAVSVYIYTVGKSQL